MPGSPTATSLERSSSDEPLVAEVATMDHDLTRIYRALRSQAYGRKLSAGQAAALWSIVNNAPVRMCALADIESVSPPTMSRIVTSLEKAGYVDRTPDPDDARARLIAPTSAGRDLVTNAQGARLRTLAAGLDALPVADQEAIGRALAVLANTLAPG